MGRTYPFPQILTPMQKSLIGLFAVCLSIFSSCTSATRGTNQQLQISSNIPKTKVELSSGEIGFTPVSFNIKKKQSVTITATKKGFQTQRQVSNPDLVGHAVGEAIVGSVLLWGPLNAADYFNGSLKKHKPVHFNMVR